MRSCDLRRIGSKPKSKNGAIATGPAIVIRYSAFETMLKSPPGNVICSTGIGILQQFGSLPVGQEVGNPGGGGIRGFFTTKELSGLRRAIVDEEGRNATGDTERISNPRISFSPP